LSIFFQETCYLKKYYVLFNFKFNVMKYFISNVTFYKSVLFLAFSNIKS